MHKHTIIPIGTTFSPAYPNCNNLWHLISIDSAKIKLPTFLSGGLWFARLDKFKSIVPEGKLPKKNAGLLEKLPEFQIKMVKNIYKLAVKSSYASCWHMNNKDPSSYVWNVFGGGGNGIAIRTTPELLKSAVCQITGNDGPVHFGEVRYIDYWQDVIPEGNVIEAAFVVDRKYKIECEARILIHTHGNAAAIYLANARGAFGSLVARPTKKQLDAGRQGFLGGHARRQAIVVKINPNLLIQEIVIGAKVASCARDKIVDLVKKHGLEHLLRN